MRSSFAKLDASVGTAFDGSVRWAIVMLLLAAGASSEAQPNSGSEAGRLKNDRPIEMTASGGLDVDLKKNIGIAKGDVVIKRDDVIVCCDLAHAYFKDDEIERVECHGRVLIVRPDGTRATADLAVYDKDSDRVTLTGKAFVRSPTADMSGQKIIYDVRADQLNVKGKRSRFWFKQKGKAPAALARVCPPPKS